MEGGESFVIGWGEVFKIFSSLPWDKLWRIFEEIISEVWLSRGKTGPFEVALSGRAKHVLIASWGIGRNVVFNETGEATNGSRC